MVATRLPSSSSTTLMKKSKLEFFGQLDNFWSIRGYLVEVLIAVRKELLSRVIDDFWITS